MRTKRPDGEPVINSSNFETRYNDTRRLTAIDCKRVHQARRIFRRFPKYCVMIVCGNVVVGNAMGAASQREACKLALASALAYYEACRMDIPDRGVVAVVSEAPTQGEALLLVNAGVDLIFAEVPFMSLDSLGKAFIDWWVGPHNAANPELATGKRVPAMVDVEEARIFIQPRWKAKPWL